MLQSSQAPSETVTGHPQGQLEVALMQDGLPTAVLEEHHHGAADAWLPVVGDGADKEFMEDRTLVAKALVTASSSITRLSCSCKSTSKQSSCWLTCWSSACLGHNTFAPPLSPQH